VNETGKHAVEVESLTYGYGDESILKNLAFRVPEGLFFTIIGPNGSGKTTLMKLMTGLEKPSTGTMKILEKPIGRYSRRELARTAAFVPQMTAVDFPFTVAEVVSMGRSPHKGLLGLDSPEDEQIIRQSMAFTQVEHLAQRKLDKLSGGEQQRVFIARAICQQPQVIFLDEPTAALDLAHQVLVMDLMERLQQEKGVTVVMVSHDVNLACMYSHTLMLLKKGEIVGIGTPKEVLTYETLEEAYGCALMVDESPLGDFPGLSRIPGGNFLRLQKLETG
jgi:iron complex transport system ATP-binding protein